MEETTELMDALVQIFRSALKREDITLTPESTARDVPGWDSLTNMVIMTQIEKTFHIRFTLREIVRMKNVGDLCRVIAEKQK